ncbi:hypothetical protein TRFO_39257 [Tritrichomonas foetus]|uniref:Smr domain-containing protein n=1 Tax=Tritrichomonas foetus TaxID=1144522 RepID=A0A1J4JAV8_9EUKA|nr:hypothetical protein TRFO_39257 [Tritrichomonas foetus]|eukprot:OHS94565.1 hypothetical protein TRFO_39257 [Tritrichomonas foetus]
MTSRRKEGNTQVTVVRSSKLSQSDLHFYLDFFNKNEQQITEQEIRDINNKFPDVPIFPELVKYVKNKNEQKQAPKTSNDSIIRTETFSKNKKRIKIYVNLHGYNINSAKMYIRRLFLDLDPKRGYKIILNIGKGKHSDNQKSILKVTIENLIDQLGFGNKKDTSNAFQNEGIVTYIFEAPDAQ